MTNENFIKAISTSFNEFLKSGTSRSTRKLAPLHGSIAEDLQEKLGEEYTIRSQGIGEGKEAVIEGRYMDKRVDITILRHDKPVAGIAVKFVMQNYSQNSNNYFENMLGETANIRTTRIPYFQIFIIFDQLPYYKRQGEIQKWEAFTAHNAEKYVKLSQDNPDLFFHTPNKTLLFIVHLQEPETDIKNQAAYIQYYQSRPCPIRLSDNHIVDLGNSVIYNDYAAFLDKVYHTILAQ